jgi:hypothetical protein
VTFVFKHKIRKHKGRRVQKKGTKEIAVKSLLLEIPNINISYKIKNDIFLI